ncbi:methylamine utilization protein MauD [Komagataeibacter europaeus]|uniref:Thioredoxin domain-containing protein n=2 Tax=Komagataeibacter europaeus TaxID=33995 RepID=A0A0D6PV50_KOMEU|nr:alkyl hydroperoxide reductase [Komagataeibacter europaeus]KON64664.1 methylamine utilization protein MauD [Komagataeibacter europaeus]GAN95054.1 hypothetical protein Geu3261_0007_005 [Komagataeibacter europaeus NBRC 3261]
MMTFLVIWQVVLAIVALGLAAGLFALARQIGILHERLAPIGPQAAHQGLDVGQSVPRLVMRTLAGAPFVIGGPLDAGRRMMVIFVAPDCPVCKRVVPLARAIAGEQGLDLVLVGDGAEPELKEMAARPDMAGLTLVTGVELSLVLQVNRLPTLVIIDDHATILAKDIVNTRRQIEAAVQSSEAGAKNAGNVTKEIAHAAV